MIAAPYSRSTFSTKQQSISKDTFSLIDYSFSTFAKNKFQQSHFLHIDRGFALDTIVGQCFLDLNCNQMLDGNDVAVPNLLLTSTNDNLVFVTDAFGEYTFQQGANTINTYAPILPPGYSSLPITIETTSDPQVFEDMNFALCPSGEIHNLAISLNALATASPNSPLVYRITVTNLGTSSDSAIVNFHTGNMAFASLIDADGATISSNNNSGTYSSVSINVSAGDQLQLYCNGSSVNNPRMLVTIIKR